VGFLAPSAWRRSAQDRVVAAEEDSDDGFDSEDGEELGDVDESTRREYSHGQDSVDATRRLSRELVHIAGHGWGYPLMVRQS